MKLGAYVPMLMRDYPDAAFTTDSLNHVARQCMKGFPTYPELANHLSGWWRDHRPILRLPPPPPEPPRPPPTPEELAYVRQRVAEVTAALRASALYVEAQSQRLDEAVGFQPRPRHLTPEQLDLINPLPNGRKRA